MSYAVLFLLAALAFPRSGVLAHAPRNHPPGPAEPVARRWKINTHLFAANQALADALNDGMVTIAPYGEFPVAAAALRALRAAPAAYRAGVLAPDLFPDMYVGGWFIHSDLSSTPERWMADDWMRHVWNKARGWTDAGERDKVMAFAYGFLTHGAGDMWAHTYVNQKADGAWVTFTGPSRSTAIKHIVLEGYIGAHTPRTDLTLDVWPRFVSNVLIKDPAARQHSQGAAHYQKWLDIYDRLEPLIRRAKDEMNRNINNDAPYWAKCAANPVPCARKEQMETWRLDINRGFRALVDSSESLGEKLMDGETGEGAGAMSGWMLEWIPKMFGAHAIGEAGAALQEFLNWVGGAFPPINEAIKAETQRVFKRHFDEYYELYKAAKDPSSYMDQLDFPPGTKQQLNQEMGIEGPGGDFNWRAFEPMYNTVILSKLALLDGDGLNELARRAGLTGSLYPPGESTNLMLGVFRSMTQSYQWMGEEVDADTGSIKTRFGICGPESGGELDKKALCGIKQRARGSLPSGALSSEAGFVLWGHPEAREKIFRVIFKGYGPGPGTTSLAGAVTDLPRAAAGVREGARALGLASDQTDHMRETVEVMRGKIAGVASAVPAATAAPSPPLPSRQPVAGRTPAATAPAPTPAGRAAVEIIADWGQRCCARDIAELRAGLAAIRTASPALQSSAALAQLGRRATASQIGALLSQLDAALNAFANTRDATAAAAALSNLSRGLDALARMVTGT